MHAPEIKVLQFITFSKILIAKADPGQRPGWSQGEDYDSF